MNHNTTGKQLLLSTFTCLSAYWLSNAVLWIPWKINEALGIVFMLIFVPVLWGFSSNFCFNRIPSQEWRKKKFLIGVVFLILGFFSDYSFFAIWRGIPNQLYKPTTFAAYGLLFVMPILIGSIKKKQTACKPITSKTLLLFFLLACLFISITLYSVQYW